MSTTMRQEGLVNQELVSSLKVAVVGNHEQLVSATQCIASHLGLSTFPWTGADPDHILLLDDAPLPEGTESACSRILLLHDGVRVTDSDDLRGGSPSKIQLPGLAMIGASLGFQEVLRQNGCIRRIDIVKSHISVHYRIDPSFTGSISDIAGQFMIRGPDGSPLPLFSKECTDDSGHISLIARIESNEDADSLLEDTHLVDVADDRGHADNGPSMIEIRIPRQTGDVHGSCVIAGAGGLGSWALNSLSEGLSCSGHEGSGIELTIIDPDLRVEDHNLNRQVLYSESDIGSPKAIAAASVIQSRLPFADVLSGVQKIGMAELEMLDGKSMEEDEVADTDEIDLGISLQSLSPSVVREVLGRANVFASCVDNLRCRTIISAISNRLGIPMINAGAGGWSGQMDVFIPAESCMVCRYGPNAAKDTNTHSCQEDGDIPFSSIVTSTALFGSLQGLALLAALSSERDLIGKWPRGMVWGGRWNTISYGSNTMPMATAEKSHSSHLLSALCS